MPEAAQPQLPIDPPAPAEAAPAAAPAADPAPAPAAAAAEPFNHAADAGPLAAADAPAAEPAKEAPKEAAAEPPREGEKPAEAEAATPETPEAKAAEAKPEPAAEPIAYEFKYPEGLHVDQDAVESATEIFQELKVPPESAQKLIDTAMSAMQRMVDTMPEQWQKSFADTKKGWIEQAMADPIIGGAAWKTSVQSANDVLANTALIPKSERAAFNAFLRDTGASHHPQMMKLLNRMNNFLREPAAPPPATDPPRGGNSGGSRKAAILTHATSKQT